MSEDSEKDYTNREIDAHFAKVNDKLASMSEQTHEKLVQILSQTTKTNGRVGSLETWQNRMIGAIGVILVLVVPVALYVIYRFIDKALR